MFTDLRVQLTLLRDQLGTNPCDPNVLDKHIIEKQRKLILEESNINREVNKYLAALPIAKERGEAEVSRLFDRLQELTGIELTDEDKKRALAGELDLLKETFESLKTTGTTVFFWDKERDLPCIGDHMIYGFLKAAAEAIGRAGVPPKKGTPMHSISYTQSLINQHVRCKSEFITFDQDIRRNDDGTPKYLQRSLRCMTAQGPRVSLAKSEVVPAGAKLDFVLRVLGGSPLLKPVEYKKGEAVLFPKAPLLHLFEYGEMTGLGQWRNSGKGQFRAETSELNKVEVTKATA